MLLEYSLRGEATLRRGITVNLVVQGRNLDITDALTDHAEQKLRRLVKYLSEEARCDLELSVEKNPSCLLYTSDAADDLTRVDLGGRRIIKKKKKTKKR